MKRKKLKKLITTVLTIAFFTNSMGTLAFGVTNDVAGKSYSDLVQSLKNQITFDEKDNLSTISNDVDTTTSDMISVIVEFVSEPLALSNTSTYDSTENKVDRDHRVFEKYLSNLPVQYGSEGQSPTIQYSYKTVFNGVSLKVKGTDIEALAKSGVVKRIHKDAEVKVDPPINEEVKSTSENEITPLMMDSIPKLGIDQLHNEDIKGQGIKVGVLDTGIDYNHPDLTNAYEGFRAENGDVKNQDINTTIGWDFVDNDADPMETTYKDWQESGQPEFDLDGNSYYTAHGTHVSGTIAGTGDNQTAEFPVLGVAPDVELYGYRVLGKYGSGSTAGIIAAIEKSVTDGMDVINMSLGSNGANGPYDPMVTAVNNATKAGVVTTIANGNSGPLSYSVGTPGTAQLPIAVGASTVDYEIKNFDLKIGDLNINASLLGPSFNYKIDDLLNRDLDVVDCGLGYPEDFEGKDLTGKIAFIDRGVLTFVEKAKNAAAAGAEAIILANNTKDNEIPFLGEQVGANILAITLDDGNSLKEVLSEEVPEQLSITPLDTTFVAGDEIAGFSSVGPVKRTYEIRPDLVAPGYNVYSTAPEYINDNNEDEENYNVAYQRMSGTSMATPHIAGIAALILQAHPEYTPEEVKLAMMNTSEQIFDEDDLNYSVHEAGAGRVNAYESVHEEVSFSAEYDVTYGVEPLSIKNITGMLSYGKIIDSKSGEMTKTIPVTVTNNSSESKSYTIVVEYSNSSRAKDAVANGFKLNLPTSVEVAAGESKTFDVTLSAYSPLEFGTYEGYIHFTEFNNTESTYQMPFSVNLMKDGFQSLTYPSLDNGYAQGITAFTCSNLVNRNPQTFYGFSDITFQLQINNEIKTIEGYVVDPETKERVGYVGKQDASWIPVGTDVMVEGFASNGRSKKIVNGKISHEEFPLQTGIYDLEVVATEYTGTVISEYLPMAVINDTYSDKVTFNMEDGVIEVTEDMYTNNVWFDDKEHEGIWLKANAYNDIVEQLKTTYGLSYLKQDEVNTIFAEGMDRSGYPIQMGTMSLGNGDILVAGVERSDLESGFFRTNLTYTNAGKIMNKPTSFIFVDKDKSYLTIDTDTDTLSKGKTLTSTISINNAENVLKGSFAIQTAGDINYDNLKIIASEELKKLAGDNIKTDITFEVVSDGWSSFPQFNVSFEITSTDSNFKGINGDMKLFDIVTDVKSYNGVDEELMDDNNFTYATFRGVDGKFSNISNEKVDVMAGTIYKTFDVEYSDRTLIYVSTTSPLGGMRQANAYVVDPQGQRYEPTYTSLDDWMGRNHRFTFNELPVIDGDYKVILEMPGCFDSVMSVPGSKLNKNNDRVGNTYSLTSASFLAPAMTSYAGDVNDDGAIDIVDAYELAKDYVPGEEHPFSLNPEDKAQTRVTDLTQDGVVNYYDMYLLLNNYLMQDLTREDSKVPEEYLDGRDIIDILESCGYYDEVPEMNIELNLDSEISLVGDTVNLTVTPPPGTEGVEFEYEFSVREKNDKEWTIIKERSEENIASWQSKVAGNYEFRSRIFLDEIEYVWQDNKVHTVNWADLKGIELSNDGLVEGVLNMNTGDKTQLSVNLNPWNARPQEFVWSSSDESVITVENGNITALKEGSATITAKTADSQFSTKCTINVKDIKIESIQLNKDTLDINVGDSETLIATIKPENATNKNVTWASADEKIVTVENGNIVGVSAGTTMVTVTSEDGNFSDSCIVNVKASEVPPTKPEAKKIILNKNNAKLNVGDNITLKASVKPTDAEMPEIVWSSSDKMVATVKDGVVTAVGSGKAKITVKSKDGKLSDTCNITVSKKDNDTSLPQTGAIAGSSLLGTAGLMTLGLSSLILIGKKKEQDNE